MAGRNTATIRKNRRGDSLSRPFCHSVRENDWDDSRRQQRQA